MSEATDEAKSFVAAHRDEAAALGAALAELTEEPDRFVSTLVRGLASLRDPAYLESVTRACPETPARDAVRGPLMEAITRPVERALRESSSMSALRLAQRLAGTDHRDLRSYALTPLRVALPHDPELSWQLMRQLGRSAEDWIAVDGLSDVWARGVLAEPFRWAELEQLLFSQHTYERRLVAATLATIPHRVPTAERASLREGASARAMELVRQLIGDAEAMVQKALAWAIREWTRVDADRTADLIEAETVTAVEQRDGARAWVLRDALTGQPPELAASVRARLRGIRRDRHAPSTSLAAARAAAFAHVLSGTDQTVAAQGARYTRSHA